MKDAYSFDLNDEEAKKSYNKMFFAYLNTFKRLGLTVRTHFNIYFFSIL